jgi:hypothetical protein
LQGTVRLAREVDRTAIQQAEVVFGVALRVEGGLLLGLGRGVAGTGTRQVVRQFVTCALQFIMQLVTVELWASRIFSCALAPCAGAALISATTQMNAMLRMRPPRPESS